MNEVRQTSDAALDSLAFLECTELSSKQIANEAFGKGFLGVDVDQFVSRCIAFMRRGAASASTSTPSHHHASQAVDSEDDVDEGSALDWHVLGRNAAFVSNRRPAVPSFLLGPLSVEKRARNTQRSARQRRDPVAAVARPEELRAEDLEKNESSNLVNLCQRIRERLDKILIEGGRAIEEFGERPDIEEFSDEQIKKVFRQNHLALNHEVSLFEFAINPDSFGQTVENLFYISFLVKDGYVRVDFDDDGLPTIRK
jgi:non-structural maintenance of chromosomes element 4